jgi:hypothetical protein
MYPFNKYIKVEKDIPKKDTYIHKKIYIGLVVFFFALPNELELFKDFRYFSKLFNILIFIIK